MGKNKKNIKLPDYNLPDDTQRHTESDLKNELDSVWDGESIDEEKDTQGRL